VTLTVGRIQRAWIHVSAIRNFLTRLFSQHENSSIRVTTEDKGWQCKSGAKKMPVHLHNYVLVEVFGWRFSLAIGLTAMVLATAVCLNRLAEAGRILASVLFSGLAARLLASRVG
jgi:hypothetical protein